MTPRAARAVAWIAGAMASTACEDVPSLVYADAAANVDGALDAGSEAGPVADSAYSEAGCPGSTLPAGASVCCGSVSCQGDCVGRCTQCETACTTAGTFCCAKTNNVLCRPAGAACP